MIKLIEYYQAGNWLLIILDFIVLVVSVLVMLEAVSVIMKVRGEKQSGEAASEA